MTLQVRPLITLVSFIISWIIGWTVIYFYLTEPNFFSGTLGVHALDVFYKILFISFNTAVGPFGVIYYSWTIIVSNDDIEVRRLFGLKVRYYKKSQLISCELVHDKYDLKKIKMVFHDGNKITVDNLAKGFEEMKNFLTFI